LIPAYIRASDVCLVPLRKSEVFKTVIPTKSLEFMACARPVVLGVEGQMREIVEEAEAGVVVEPENPTALAGAIRWLYDNPDQRRALGQNGRKYVEARMSRREKAASYARLLGQIVGRSKPALVSTLGRPTGRSER
jgi:glycosyltransferase involved in cell wall biosynthesis